jgi:hypothetical protein
VRSAAEICRKIIWASVFLYVFFLPWGVSGTEIALGTALLAWVVKSLVERSVCWLGKPVGWPVLAFVVMLTVASLAAHSAWRGDAMRELVSFRSLLAIFLVASNLRAEEGLRRLALFFVGSLALFSLYATVGRLAMLARNEAMYWPLVVEKPQAERIEHDRLLGPLDEEGRLEPGGEPGALWLPDLGSMSEAGQLAMAVPLAFALLPAVQRRKLLPVFVAALIALAVNLLLNMKRGAWMACVTALLVLAIVERKRAALAIVGAFIVAVVVIPAARNRVVETLAGNDGHRFRLWAAVPRVLRVYPLGVGLGCSRHVVMNKAFVPRDVYLAMPNRDHFHNTIAELAVCASPLAVAAYLWWFGAFGVWALRRLRRMPLDAVGRPIVLAGLLAAVAFFVNGLVEYNLGDSDVTMMLYLLMGMAMAAAPRMIEKEHNLESTHAMEANNGEG